MLSYKVSFGRIKSRMSTLARGLSKENVDVVTKARATQMLEDFKQQTPIRWTGKTRRSWILIQNKVGSWSVRNYKLAMKFLLRGTAPHGPLRAPRMFIPLNPTAAQAYRARAVAKKRRERVEQKRGTAVKAKPRDVVKLKYGVDYVLAKYVKGIEPLTLKSRGVYYGGESKASQPSDRFVREYLKKLKSEV